MVFVFSTMTSGVDYAIYDTSIPGGVPVILKKITINGGANLVNERGDTPKGVVTQLSDEDFALLEQDSVFKIHLASGNVWITKDKEVALETVVADMNPKDKSAPLTPEDFDKPKPGEVPLTPVLNAPKRKR
jgi:hypothetical protein